MIITTQTEEETIALGRRVGTLLKGGDVLLLDGDLGAGKTHFSKGVARGLGVTQEVTSPTFNLMLEYTLTDNRDTRAHRAARLLRHFDLYRLESPEHLDDIDYFGLIEEADCISLVEWGSKFEDALPLDYVHIIFEHDEHDPSLRKLQWSANGVRGEQLLQKVAALNEGEAVHCD